MRGAVATIAGQTDFAPTLLALLGVDPANLPFAGRNLLGDPDDPPLLRPYGEWIDRTHLFLSRTSSGRGHSCYSLPQGVFQDEAACRAANDAAARARAIGRLVIVEDLQQRLRDALQ
jgi:hypothetical protein